MKNRFHADAYFDTVEEITPAFLHAKGIRAVLVDLDNTLADYDTPEPLERTRLWLESLERAGVRAAIASNNRRERVERYCAGLAVPYYWRCGKPLGFRLRRAMRALGAVPGETALIGDKRSTDVYGARRLGLYAVQVRSIKPRGGLIKRLFGKDSKGK